jgi:hypothetical protein
MAVDFGDPAKWVSSWAGDVIPSGGKQLPDVGLPHYIVTHSINYANRLEEGLTVSRMAFVAASKIWIISDLPWLSQSTV